MDVSALIAEYGAYYQNRGQRLSDVFRLLLTEMVTASVFQTIARNDSIYEAAQATIGELIQPFQKAWTPKGEAAFAPATIRAYKIKVDYEVYPDDIEDNWLGFLADKSLNRRDWPIIRYLIENLITPRVADDMETKALFHGVYAAPTAGTPGAASASMNGIRKIINDAITATTISPITMGAIPASDVDFVTYVENFVEQVNVRYRNQQMPLLLNEDLAFRYKQGFHEKYNVNYQQATDDMSVRFRRVNIMGVPSMAGSNKLIMTPQANMKKLLRRDNIGQYAIEQEDRKVKIWTDYTMGLGFILHEIVFTNDLDLI
jgi:lipopolysaccharide assembly outer membrane protein LptD (OstA)